MTALTRFVNAAQALLDSQTTEPRFLSCEGAGRYTRIICADQYGNQRFGFATIDTETGSIHRMTSLRAFHKAVRGSIYEADPTACLNARGVTR